MRITMVSLCMILLPALVWAGTFRDDFEDGDFEGWKVVMGDWELKDGHLFCRREDIFAASLSMGDNTWKEHSIECDIRIVSEFPVLKARYIGINPRNIAYGTGLSMMLSRNWGGRQGIHAHGGFNFNFKQHVFVDREIELNRWYHLKSVIKGNHYQFYVDGELVLDFNDDTFQSGRVGLLMGGLVGEFDNVVITGDNIPNTGPSGINSAAVRSSGKITTTWALLKKL